MYFKSPKFWKDTSFNFLTLLLKPISWAYAAAVRKNYRKEYVFKSSSTKVIAVGAVTVGGSGKTVVTASLCDILRAQNKSFVVLSRGYGRKCSATMLVDSSAHTFEDVGDEPLLMSKDAMVVVGVDRAASLKLAEETFEYQQGTTSAAGTLDFAIMDDGLTQRYLEPDLKFVVIDESQKFGNGAMLPAGPNRLNFREIKHHIDAVITLRNESQENAEMTSEILDFSPVISGRLKQDFSKIDVNGKFFAFCGIGYPEKFFSALRELNVVGTASFPDHYPYSSLNISRLLETANRSGATLLTTEKDFMRIPTDFRKFIVTIPVKIIWDDISAIEVLLR